MVTISPATAVPHSTLIHTWYPSAPQASAATGDSSGRGASIPPSPPDSDDGGGVGERRNSIESDVVRRRLSEPAKGVPAALSPPSPPLGWLLPPRGGRRLRSQPGNKGGGGVRAA